MDTLLVGPAVAQAGATVGTAEENGIAGLALSPWYFPSEDDKYVKQLT